MAVRRKASAYSKRKPVVNTRRSKKQLRNYVKTVPPQKVVKFNMGDYNGFQSNAYSMKAILSSDENIQIRDFALEAARQSLLKDFTKLFQKSFFMQCNVYPHNILRNNKIFSGGSKGERIQTGMQKSFGSSEGRAATVKKGKAIFTVYFNDESHISKLREFFKKIKPKVPCRALVHFEKLSSNN